MEEPSGPEAAGAPAGRAVDAALRGRLRSFAFRLTGDADLAEDVAQETVLRVLAERAPADVPWMLRVALNLVRTEYRRAARRRTAGAPVETVADPRSPEPLRALADAEERAEVWESLGLLPERERAALLLRYAEGLSCAEVAAVLGSTPNAVSCLLHRGKERMRETLAPRSLP